MFRQILGSVLMGLLLIIPCFPDSAYAAKKDKLSLTTSDDIVVKGIMFYPRDKTPHPAIVLGHMYDKNHITWLEFCKWITDKGYVSVAIDFRGFGDTGGDKDFANIHKDFVPFVDYETKTLANTNLQLLNITTTAERICR